jgi:SAM-dependent methyltransferase
MPVAMGPLERFAFAVRAAPAPVLDYVGALGIRAVYTAMRLGVFRELSGGPRRAADVAQELSLDPRGLRTLLDALVSVGYVRRRAEEYALTPMATKWVPRFAEGVDFYEWMAGAGWDTMADRLRGRAGPDDSDRTFIAGATEHDSFAGMVANARLAADEVVQRSALGRTPRRLLDIGGGHGVFAARFCRRHPDLRATVVDTPEVLGWAAEVLAEEGVADRVDRRPGDFWRDDLGSGYDAVLLCNLLNAYPDDRKRELLARAGAALAPGGRLVVLDQMRQAAKGGTARAIVELTNLRLYDPARGGTYAMPDLVDWLKMCGLDVARARPLMSVPWMGLVVARTSSGRAQRSQAQRSQAQRSQAQEGRERERENAR